MHRSRVGIVAALLAMLTIWGCAQNPASDAASAERAAKASRLQDEIRTVTAHRDQLRKDLAAATAERTRLQDEVDRLQETVKERDLLREQLVARTGERDASLTQLDQLRKSIRALLEQADAGKPGQNPPVSQVENKTASDS